MKRIASLSLALALLFSFIGPITVSAAPLNQWWYVPFFSITNVVKDTSVSISTYNFPTNDTYNVFMSYMGTLGTNGYYVATINSGSSGAFTASFNIPPELQGLYQISIRLESPYSGYYSFNWFYNNPQGSYGVGGPYYNGYNYSNYYYYNPSFLIKEVVMDTSVAIRLRDFPANQTYSVLMNTAGTQGINGTDVGTVTTDSNGSGKGLFNFPDSLKGQGQIDIRIVNTSTGEYYYNWFYNENSSFTYGTGGPYSGGTYTGGYYGIGGYYGGYYAYPTFGISNVARNSSVTIFTYNLPPNDRFDVSMGPMGSNGIYGYYVTSVDSGAGGNVSFTFDIPPQMRGAYQIAIRLQSPTSGYYAYNWFYN
jgi:hypothetical protein